MASSLPLLIVSLLAADPSPRVAPTARGPSNAERARMGLLPRRVAPSRVTYLAEAARSRADRCEFPDADAPPVVLDAPAVPDAVAGVAAPAETPVVAHAGPAPAAAPIIRAEAPRAQRVLPSEDEEPVPQVTAPVQVTAPAELAAPAEVTAPVQMAAPAQVAAPAVASPPPEPEHATETVALVTQRFVDGEGRIVVRLLGPKAKILSERVDGDVRALPVRWAGRTDHGQIIELVEDAWGPIEVRRDPVGRFLSARAVDGPDGED
ncbi:MAG TPA: hypothetical protein VEB43_00805 [Anaeromyxobacter sp.]|nr:hypothetical protein [Anaeromyxobacter sp.]